MAMILSNNVFISGEQIFFQILNSWKLTVALMKLLTDHFQSMLLDEQRAYFSLLSDDEN